MYACAWLGIVYATYTTTKAYCFIAALNRRLRRTVVLGQPLVTNVQLIDILNMDDLQVATYILREKLLKFIKYSIGYYFKENYKSL